MVKNGEMVSPDPAPDPLAEAWRLQKLGVETMNVGKLSEAAQHLRSGLGLVGWQEGKPLDPPLTLRAVAARLLISLAYAESEQGRHQYGLSLLDLAEPLTPLNSVRRWLYSGESSPTKPVAWNWPLITITLLSHCSKSLVQRGSWFLSCSIAV